MRIDGLRIERSEYKSKIVFHCDGSVAEIEFYSSGGSDRHRSFDPAVKLLNYIEFLIKERVAMQEKYIATLDKYASVIKEQTREREASMKIDATKLEIKKTPERKAPKEESFVEAIGAAVG